MRRKGLLISMAAAALLMFLVFSGTSGALKNEFTSTTEVSIDGMSFRADDSFSDNAARLRRELSDLGVQAPDSIIDPEPSRETHRVFSRKFVGSGKTLSLDLPDLPQGLTMDHTLRLSGGNRTVVLVFGKLEQKGTAVASHLEAKGWKPLALEGIGQAPRMLQQVRGKEIAVVCLDEKESAFLLFRKLER